MVLGEWNGFMSDKVELDFTLLCDVIRQLINSDGMKVTEDYLLQQRIYYIDNVSLIEKLEKIVMKHYYVKILGETGGVTLDMVLRRYSPQYINYDKYYQELESENKEHGNVIEKKDDNTTLNKYL